MMENLDPLLIPLLTSGIIGTTLCIAIFTMMIKIKIFQKWRNPLNIAIIPAIFFLLSVYFDVFYILFSNALFIETSLTLFLIATSLIFILIILLMQLPSLLIMDKILDDLNDGNL
jgi:hypothetical protein